MDFNYDNRQGMTVNPDVIDEATGQRIPGTSQVRESLYSNYDKQIGNYHGEGEGQYEDLGVNEDAYAPEDREQPVEVQLAETVELIENEIYATDPNFAQELAAIEMPPGDTAGALVQNLSVAVYNGQVTQSEAIQMAIESGEDVSTLVYYFNAIKGLYED